MTKFRNILNDIGNVLDSNFVYRSGDRNTLLNLNYNAEIHLSLHLNSLSHDFSDTVYD